MGVTLPPTRNFNSTAAWTKDLVLSVVERGTREDWQRMFDAAKESPELVERIRAVTAPPIGYGLPKGPEDSRGINERFVFDLVNHCFPANSSNPA
jgi:hypothetical protein